MIVQLTSLLESQTSLLLAYAVPLLLLSLVLTFAGTFLTLDRTRTFASRSDTMKLFPGAFDEKKPARKCAFRLNGGVGGLIVGYLFGVHGVTFCTLLISNNTSSRPLGPTAFLLTWLFSIFPPIVLGGRWRTAAILFLGICGGITLSLAISIITHPSLSSRIVLTSVITPLMTVAVVVPALLPSLSQSNLAHSTARMASSCSGAFSVTMAVAILTRSPSSHSWANIWERLWVANGPGWGTGRERGFDALFSILWVCGAMADWALRKWIGEDPEEKWDTYLAEYATTLPNIRDRAGQFEGHKPWWKRVLQRLHLVPVFPNEIIFPDEKDFTGKTDYTSTSGALLDSQPIGRLSREDLQTSPSPEAYNWMPDAPAIGPGILRKGKSWRKGGFKRVQDREPDVDSHTIDFDLSRRPTHLQKSKSVRMKHCWHHFMQNKHRPRVEFMSKEGFSSESDREESSDDDLLETAIGSSQGHDPKRVSPPRTNSRTSMLSGTTAYPSSSSGHDKGNLRRSDALDTDAEKAQITNIKASFGSTSRVGTPNKAAPEYSDVEEDVTAAYSRKSSHDQVNSPGWKPEFLRRALIPNVPGDMMHDRKPVEDPPASPVGIVPMTPSLVTALGRIAKAQADAYGHIPERGVSPISPPVHQALPGHRREHVAIPVDGSDGVSGLPVVDDKPVTVQEDSGKWKAFWNEIQTKAAET